MISQRPNRPNGDSQIEWSGYSHSHASESYLTRIGLSARGMAKAILLGEHSVVYGKPAIAVALPGLSLNLELLPPHTGQPNDWISAWRVGQNEDRNSLALEHRTILTKCLDRALRESALGCPLDAFKPQPILLRSNFPMGAGLGGSAALCVAAVRLADQIAESLVPELFVAQRGTDGLERANSLDNLFHGTASGIDTATSFSEGLIECTGNGPSRRFRGLTNGRRFYLALVDSGVRSETSGMVEKIRLRKKAQPIFVDEKMARLGELAHHAGFQIREGRLDGLGPILNETHEHLADLGLSTPRLDQIVQELRELGALGAKLTGSGGGGFALGLFRDYPEWVETHLPTRGIVYVSEVPVSDGASFSEPAVGRGVIRSQH